MKWHPDKDTHLDEEAACERSKALNEAYTILSDGSGAPVQKAGFHRP